VLNERWFEIPFRLVVSSRRTAAKLGQVMHGLTPGDFP
jgi:hypothetical protein